MKLPKPIKTDLCQEAMERKIARRTCSIGEGAFATVYKHPSIKKRVYKIGGCDDNPNEEGYLAFVKKVMRNSKNPFFPKIYSVRIYRYVEKLSKRDAKDGLEPCSCHYYVVEMEKLTKFFSLKDHELIMARLLGRKTYNQWGVEALERVRRHYKGHLRKAVKALQPLFKEYSRDMHEGNVMWRTSRKDDVPQLVIIDPVA